MLDWSSLALNGASASAATVVARLAAALAMGALVAVIYRRTRPAIDVSDSFTITLVLLAILIAMVTQVIGDNVARAFSLVGALSIVRFRTVVRDTQDTAYVIFAVAVGMAVGADNVTVALIGAAMVALAAFFMRGRNMPAGQVSVADLPFVLRVRIGLGADAESLLGSTLEQHGVARRLMTVETARQGLALEVGYRASLRDEAGAPALVTALNRIDGVQAVVLQRTAPNET